MEEVGIGKFQRWKALVAASGNILKKVLRSTALGTSLVQFRGKPPNLQLQKPKVIETMTKADTKTTKTHPSTRPPENHSAALREKYFPGFWLNSWTSRL